MQWNSVVFQGFVCAKINSINANKFDNKEFPVVLGDAYYRNKLHYHDSIKNKVNTFEF